ncbi:hypothetical protein BP5796_12216 [Coleophoma crateriformis]|uniref:Uncharacterized protein n=1 Tax=Coleophoma crateriformis TaxID=565419 RepID=A0A3D8Q8Z0_9HELO|nr:hypothetical protein BP5796_12216 [Coleophoma crateriformis]
MAWQTKSKARWDYTLELHKGRLGKHAQDVDDKLDYDRFEIFLEQLETQSPCSRIGKVLSSKVMDHIQGFTAAITSICQSNTFSSLAWGILQLVLKAAFAFTKVFGTVTEMLSEISLQLPILEQYRSIFPTAYELDEPLMNLYSGYVNFCIDIVLFFKSGKWVVFRRLAFGNLSHCFEQSKVAISEHLSSFKTALDLADKRQRSRTDQQIMTLNPINIWHSAFVKGIPFQQNARFLGRDGVLDKLHKNLIAESWLENRRQLSCTIIGMGGIGKTQVALEYTFRHRAHYSNIFWLKAETAPGLAASFGNLARQLCPGQAAQDQHRNIELVLDWFMNNRSWLIVFDNVEVDLTPYWPPSIHGSTIITTQRQDVTHRTTSTISLDTFDEDDGANLILSIVDPIGCSRTPEILLLAKQISNEIGGLPLLLSHVAGFIATTKCHLSDLLSSLQEPAAFKKLWAFDSTTSTNFQYGEPMRKVFDISLRALDPNAIETLYIIAMLDSDGVAEELLFDDWAGKDLDFLAPSKKFDIRRSLVNRHLVTATMQHKKQSLTIHRSLKQYLIHFMDEQGSGKLSLVFSRALAIVRKAYPVGHELQAPTNHTWAQCETTLPHVTSLHSIFEKWSPRILPTLTLATLLTDVANYMWERGIVREGITIMDTGEAVCSSLKHLKDITTVHAHICAIALSIHADLGYSGRQRAYNYALKGLALRQDRVKSLKIVGIAQKVDFLNLANAWNDVGVMLIQQHEFEEAQLYFNESLRIKREWTTEDDIPWHYGETYKNMAFVELSRGNLDEAKTYVQKATSLCTRDMPEKCASSMKAHFIEATIALNSRNLLEALDKHKYIFRIRKEIFGDTHQLTKDSIFALGEIYRLREKFERAEYVKVEPQMPRSD